MRLSGLTATLFVMSWPPGVAEMVDFPIVIAPDCGREVKAAAEDLASMLRQMTGKGYPVTTDEEPLQGREIIVGNNRHLKEIGLKPDWQKIHPDGYIIRKSGERLVIAGGPERGTLNGIYEFLEKYLGCRWFAPDCTVIPKRKEIEFPDIDIQERPAFRWRGLQVRNSNYVKWAARNRGNYYCQTFGSVDREEGGRRYLSWGRFRSRPLNTGIWWEARWHVHNLGHDLLLPTGKYFDKHPEYFSLVGGKRIRKKAQPCLTNPAVVQIVAENAKKYIASDPDGRMMDISLGDHGNMCECKPCWDSNAKYGRSGTYFRLVNKVVEIIRKDYPDVLINTLAYWPVEAPPRGGVKPHEKVIVEAGYLQACRYHTFDECEYNRSRGYLETLKKWIALAPDRVMLWLYTYGNGPQMHRFERSYKLFRDIGVKGFFLCHHMRAKPFQMDDLEQYLHARLMWDPDTDIKKTIQEFCLAFYGAAGPELAEYFHAINDESAYTGTNIKQMKEFAGFHCRTAAPPLNLKTMRQLDPLLERAAANVKDDPLRLKRVQQARLFLQHDILCHSPLEEAMFDRARRDFPLAAASIGLTQVNNPHLNGGTRQDIETFIKAMSLPGKWPKEKKKAIGPNLLKNSSFEEDRDGDGVPDAWDVTGEYLPEGYRLDKSGVTLLSTGGRTGTRFVRFSKKPAPQSTVAIRQKFKVKPGEIYRARLFCKVDVKKGAFYIIFSALDAEGRFLRHHGGGASTRVSSKEWKMLETGATVSEDTAQMMIEALFYPDDAEGEAELDDFSVGKVEP